MEDAARASQARNATQRQKLEKMTGARWSELFRLGYYDSIRMVAVDTMHNLFLQTARHVMRTWVDCKVLTDNDLVGMLKDDACTTPSTVRLQQRQIARATYLQQCSYADGPQLMYTVGEHDNVCVLSGEDRDCMTAMYTHLYGADIISVLEFVQTVRYVMQVGEVGSAVG